MIQKKYVKIMKKYIQIKLYICTIGIANVSIARNIGIEKAEGSYLAFIDADDEYIEDFLLKSLDCMINTQSQLVTCGYKTTNTKKNYLLKEYKSIETTKDIKKYLEITKENYLFNQLWNKLYITKIIKENNIKFDSTMELGEDFIFNLDYLKYVKKASFINDVMYIYKDSLDGLNLRYRPDKFDIEYKLTKYLEKYYKEKNYSLEYIYNRFARVYYNGIIDIYSKNNPLSKKEKNKQLKEFTKREKYKKDLEFLKDKITDRKFKVAVKYFFLGGNIRRKIFIHINSIRKV